MGRYSWAARAREAGGGVRQGRRKSCVRCAMGVAVMSSEGSIPQEPPENHAGCLPPWAGAEQLFAIPCPLWLKVDMVMHTYLPPGLGCV